MPAFLCTCTTAAKFKETRLKRRERRKTCWSDQQNHPVKTSNRVTMGDYVLIQSTLFSLIPPLMTVQCHCLGFISHITHTHCPSARLQHQPNIILSVSPQNPQKGFCQDSTALTKSVCDLMAPITTSLVFFVFPLLSFMDFFSKAYQMMHVLTHPQRYLSLISWPWTRETLPCPWVRGLRSFSTGHSDDYCFIAELHPEDRDTTTGLCSAASRSYFWDLQLFVSPREMWQRTCCWAWASCSESFSRKSYGKMQNGVLWDV